MAISLTRCLPGKKPNNRVSSDSKKRRSFVALLFAAGYAKRSGDAARHPNGPAAVARGSRRAARPEPAAAPRQPVSRGAVRRQSA